MQQFSMSIFRTGDFKYECVFVCPRNSYCFEIILSKKINIQASNIIRSRIVSSKTKEIQFIHFLIYVTRGFFFKKKKYENNRIDFLHET